MGRTLRSRTGEVTNTDITTSGLTATGLITALAGTQNVIGYTSITTGQTLLDADGFYIIRASTSIVIDLPATTTNGRTLFFADGTNFGVTSVTIGRNGANIQNLPENLVLNIPTSFQMIYNNGNWDLIFYR